MAVKHKAGVKTHASTNKTGATPDAIALLSADHRTVEKLFRQYEKADSSGEKKSLAQQICTELTIHTLLEEEIFYPACRKGGVASDHLDEAQVEHDTAKVLIADLKAESPRDDFYDAKMTVLTEYIKHHVAEEERPRSGVFAQARSSGLDLDTLAEQLRARKAQLSEEAEPQEKPVVHSLHIANVAAAPA